MITTPQIFERIHRAFDDGQEGDIAKNLFDFLKTNRATTHVNIQLMRQITPDGERGDKDAAIVRTLQFLAGEGISVLTARFELIAEDEHPHLLSDEEVRDAVLHLVNPVTGESDPTVKEKIFLYFSPTEVFSELAFNESIDSSKGG